MALGGFRGLLKVSRRGILVRVVAFMAALFLQSRDLANLKDVLNEMLTFALRGKGPRRDPGHFWRHGEGFVFGHG